MLFCVIIPWHSRDDSATRTGSLLVASIISLDTCSSMERFSAASFRREEEGVSYLACFDLLLRVFAELGLTSKSLRLMEGERAREESPAVISAKLRCDWEDWLPVATADATCVLFPVRVNSHTSMCGGGGCRKHTRNFVHYLLPGWPSRGGLPSTSAGGELSAGGVLFII